MKARNSKIIWTQIARFAARAARATTAFHNVRETFSAEAVAQRYGVRLREILA